MKWVKVDSVNEPQTGGKCRWHQQKAFKKTKTMKIVTQIALIATVLTTAVAAQAEWVSGHFRSNGTYVAPYYRTPANGTPYDNLSYRGYPSQQPGYVAPRPCDYGTLRTLPAVESDGAIRLLRRNFYGF